MHSNKLIWILHIQRNQNAKGLRNELNIFAIEIRTVKINKVHLIKDESKKKS